MTRTPWRSVRGARRTLNLTLVSSLVAAALTIPALGAASDPRSGQVCIATWKESPYRNFGYDHVVAIRNDCDRAVRCAVTTNAARHRHELTVASARTSRVLTFRGAPRPAFSARVACIAER